MDADKLLEWCERIGIQDLREANGNIRGLCPFHEETTPSRAWGISLAEPHPYGCFSCGATGTLYHLLLQVGNVDPKKALKICLLHESQKRLPEFELKIKEKPRHLIDPVLLYPFVLTKKARTRLAERGISRSAMKTARISFDQFNNRILFPWWENKKLVGVTARSLTPGYPIKSEPIWGTLKKSHLYLPQRKIKEGKLTIVEGEIDALSLVSVHENVAAVGRGTFSKDQARFVIESECDEVCIFTDDDEAGSRLGDSIEKSLAFTKRVSRVNYAPLRVHYDEDVKLDPAALRTKHKILVLKSVKKNSTWPTF